MKTIICRDLDENYEEVPAEKFTFRPAVYGLIIKDDEILLSRQWDGYDFPGGAIEIYESIPEALTREVKEETGLDIEPVEIVTAENCHFKMPTSGKYVNSILLYYLCKISGGEISDKHFTDSEKAYVKAAEWVKVSELEKVKLYSSAGNMKIIGKALEIYRRTNL